MKGLHRILKANSELRIGMILLLLSLLIATIGPILVPYDPLKVDISKKLQAPSFEHWIGTDNMGRDIFARLILGARVTLSSSLLVVFINLAISIPLGILSGYVGGILDGIMSRFVEIIMAFPQIIISLYLLANWGPGFQNLLLSMIVVGWVKYARLIRGNTKKIKHSGYIKAAEVSGSSNFKIVVSHIFPNVISPVLSLAAIDVAHVILSISSLSFLGLGISPPTPEWGIMLNEAKPFMNSHPHMMWGPGLCILGVVLSFSLIGRGLKAFIQS